MSNDDIEMMIDADGLANVLRAFLQQCEEICGEKAEHLRSNWQDENQAKVWDRNARAIERLRNGATINNLEF